MTNGVYVLRMLYQDGEKETKEFFNEENARWWAKKAAKSDWVKLFSVHFRKADWSETLLEW